MDNTTNFQERSEASLRLSAIFEAATDGIIIINDRGIMELVNPSAARLFGYTPEEMISQNVSLLTPFPHKEQHDGYLENYHRTGVGKIIGIGREVEGQKKDGTLFPCRLSISEVKLENRRIFTGIIHDLTEQKEAEQRIIKLNAELEKRVEERTEELANAVNQLLDFNHQLEHEIKERKIAEKLLKEKEIKLKASLEKEKELNALKSRFVSTASHEFRTPLSTILSSADLIEAYAKEEQQKKREKHTTRIKSAVANLTGVLNEFLSLSKLEEGQIQAQPVKFNLRIFCKELFDDLQGLLRPGQYIRHNGDKNDTIVFLDKKFLKNIMLNLFSNAIKYSENEQPIDCSLEINNNYLHIKVTDYGIGIPEEEQQHLFSQFFRAHNVENIQGTGLGLNIVKSYLELMKGNITFESKLGEGTTFIVALPLNLNHP